MNAGLARYRGLNAQYSRAGACACSGIGSVRRVVGGVVVDRIGHCLSLLLVVAVSD